jgi:hypothetical protein
MSTRTVEEIEREISEIKGANPDWMRNSVDKGLITVLTAEKNTLGKFSSKTNSHY